MGSIFRGMRCFCPQEQVFGKFGAVSGNGSAPSLIGVPGLGVPSSLPRGPLQGRQDAEGSPGPGLPFAVRRCGGRGGHNSVPRRGRHFGHQTAGPCRQDSALIRNQRPVRALHLRLLRIYSHPWLAMPAGGREGGGIGNSQQEGLEMWQVPRGAPGVSG